MSARTMHFLHWFVGGWPMVVICGFPSRPQYRLHFSYRSSPPHYLPSPTYQVLPPYVYLEVALPSASTLTPHSLLHQLFEPLHSVPLVSELPLSHHYSLAYLRLCISNPSKDRFLILLWSSMSRIQAPDVFPGPSVSSLSHIGNKGSVDMQVSAPRRRRNSSNLPEDPHGDTGAASLSTLAQTPQNGSASSKSSVRLPLRSHCASSSLRARCTR